MQLKKTCSCLLMTLFGTSLLFASLVSADISWNTVGNVQSCHVCSDGSEWLIVQNINDGSFNSASHQTTAVNNYESVTVDNATMSVVVLELDSGPMVVGANSSLSFPFEPGIFTFEIDSTVVVAGDKLTFSIATDSTLTYDHCYEFLKLPGVIDACYTLMETDSDQPGVATNVLEDRLGISCLEFSPASDVVTGEFLFGLPPFIPGDVNDDGLVNLLDVAPFIEVLNSGGFSFAADVNGDHHVNLLDVEPFIDLLGGK